MRQQVRRGRPGRRLVLGVDGGVAAVALALACVQHTVVMVSRLRWAAARSHPPGLPPPGTRGRQPTTGTRQRSWQGWAARADPPWATVAATWDGGARKPLWGFSRPALWDTPGLSPVELRDVRVADPEGKWRREAFVWTDVQAPPEQSLAWVVMRWAVEVTCDETRAPLGLETPRPWADWAIARTTPVLRALCSLVTLVTRRLSQEGPSPGQATAW